MPDILEDINAFFFFFTYVAMLYSDTAGTGAASGTGGDGASEAGGMRPHGVCVGCGEAGPGAVCLSY
eukprot:SAG11_NODE_5510_length_1536_cov_1.871012_1_plen_66_part_10